MGVAMRSEVIGGRAVPEVDVGDQSHLLERFEEAIHRGDMHVGQCSLHPADELVSRNVVRLVEQDTKNRLALIGHATTKFADRLQGAVDRVGADHDLGVYDYS